MERPRVAVFIDAENVPATLAAGIIAEASRQGVIRVCRIYGDFSKPGLGPWLKTAPEHALTPCQTVGGVAGKNSADIALVIDVVERLCQDEADVFCLATSDRDFSQLAIRIRQRGKGVVGLGEAKAPVSFRQACGRFVEMKLPDAPMAAVIVVPEPSPDARPDQTKRKLDPILFRQVMAETGEGWMDLARIGHAFRSIDPRFSARSYGHSLLHELLAFSGISLRRVEGNRLEAKIEVPGLKQVAGTG